MKKLISIFLCVVLAFSILSVSVSAQESGDILLSQEVQILENGDMVTTEIYLNTAQPLTGISAHKDSTYSTASGKKMWALRVYGTFTYTYGVSSSATAAAAEIIIYDSGCKEVSKNAYTHGNTATATGSAQYGGAVTNWHVDLSCDIYGNLY